MDEGDADERAPEEAGQDAHPGPGEEPAEHGRKHHRQGDEEGECAVDAGEVLVGGNVRGIDRDARLGLVEQPAHVGEVEALCNGATRGAEPPRRVGILDLVGELVVLAVIGDPLGNRALHRHRAGRGQDDLHGTRRLEGRVGEEAVVAHRDAEGSERPESDEQGDVRPSEEATPGDRYGHSDGDERDRDEQRDDDAHPAADRDLRSDWCLGLKVCAGGHRLVPFRWRTGPAPYYLR